MAADLEVAGGLKDGEFADKTTSPGGEAVYVIVIV